MFKNLPSLDEPIIPQYAKNRKLLKQYPGDKILKKNIWWSCSYKYPNSCEQKTQGLQGGTFLVKNMKKKDAIVGNVSF